MNHLKLILGLNIYFVLTAIVGIFVGSVIESLNIAQAPASRLIGLGIMLPVSWVGVYFFYKKFISKPKPKLEESNGK